MCIILNRSAMVNRPKHRAPWDLLAILALTALLLICILLTSSNFPRVVLGLPFLLFFPGYVMLSALFPRKASLVGTERFALSFVLSMAIVSMLALLLSFVWRISLYPLLMSVAVLVACMSAVAYVRRALLPPQEQYQPRLNLHTTPLPAMSRRDRILAAFLITLVICAAAALVYVESRPGNAERFTEFYLLGSSQTAQYYPEEVVLGTDATATVGVINHEGKEMTYHVQILLNSVEVQTMDGVALADGTTWEEPVTLTPVIAGDDQQVEFLLYRVDESEPYRSLHLWIDVRDPSVPSPIP